MFLGLYLPIHYFGWIGAMFHQVQAGQAGLPALKGDQLIAGRGSLDGAADRARLLHVAAQFGSALTARNEDVFRRNAIVMPLYQLLIAFVFFVGFAAVLRLPGLGEDQTGPRAARHLPAAFPDWFVGLIGSAGMLCALVPGSMLLIASATIVARNVFRALNPAMSDAAVTRADEAARPVVGLAAVAFVFARRPDDRDAAAARLRPRHAVVPGARAGRSCGPGWVTRAGAIAGIVVGVGVVAAMTFSGATPGSSTTLDALVGGLPAWLADLNLGVVALLANVLVMCAVSAATRGAAPVEGARTADAPRFSRAGEPALQRTPQS